MDELKRYYAIAKRMASGDVPKEDLEFFLSFSPKLDRAKLQKLAADEGKTLDDVTADVLSAGHALQTSDSYKDTLLEVAQSAETGKLGDDLAAGINLVLAGSNIAQSINQIRTSNNQLSRSKKPTRPVIPARDAALQQALRSSQEGTNDAGRALAPAQAQIQDQYQNDIANAKIASTGQAGAYGSYAQLAADRRNRSSMELAPIQDQIRRGEQDRTDRLIGARMGETQQMYENQAQMYPDDLYQYNQEQVDAGQLGAYGRGNLNRSLSNAGQQAAPFAAKYLTERRHRNLRNKATAMYGPDFADIAVDADKGVNGEWEYLNQQDSLKGY